MPHKVLWSDIAKTDFKEILKYLTETWGKDSSQKFKKNINRHIEIIGGMPKLFPSIDYIRNVRKCVVVRQVSLYYMEDEKEKIIIIMRLLDNRRDPDKIKKSLEAE